MAKPSTRPAAIPAEALHFRQVSKAYGRQPVLDDLELVVGQGECLALVGVNGAGKTTAIKTLLDFSRPDRGTVVIRGESNRAPRARRHLAYLPERFTPPHYLSGRDFLRNMCRLHGVAFDPGRVLALFEALALEETALDKPVRTFSKGMAQKLGLAMCFLSERPLLVLDEPMSGLDPQARALVKRRLQALRQEGRTLFFSTHLLADVEALCDRMAILHRGRLQVIGTPTACRERYQAPDLEAAFLACIAAG